MFRRRKKLESLGRFFDVPSEIILDLPRLTGLGNKQMLIENHKGIIEYSSLVVRIKVNSGEIIIKGRNLSIGVFQAEQLLVEGIIEVIEYGF
ncbi:sporulation protein YqfC [Selenomonadales bacterium OttesenSCG-928-I06]|nr:sporulation protein YqfC [Selenomonadales bacterium OttesenSCG-928-I06]